MESKSSDLFRLTGFGIALEAQHDFGRTIPSSRNILGHVASVLLRIHGEASSKAKVANLELAVCVDEQVAWLEISMQNIGRVDILQTTEDLIDE